MPAPDTDGLVWKLDAAHFPGPVTRWSSALFSTMETQILSQLMAEAGILLDGIAYRELDGRIYTAIVPLGGRVRDPSPRWLAPILCRTMPSIRRRLAAAHTADVVDTHGQTVEQWLGGKEDDLLERGRAFLVGDLGALTTNQVADRLEEQLRFLQECFTWHFRLHGAGADAIGRLGLELTSHHGWTVPEYLDLFTGLSDTALGPVQAQRSIVELIAAAGDLATLDDATSLRDVAEISPQVAAALQAYQDLWGQRAVRYEVAYPTVVERPEWLLRQLKEVAHAPVDGELAARHDRARRRAESRLITTLGASMATRRRLERAQRAFPLREGNEPATIGVPIAGLRRLGLHIGFRLGLYRPDDVFDLTFDEVLLWLRSPDDQDELAMLALHRREQREALTTKEPAPVLGAVDGEARRLPDLRGFPKSALEVLAAFLWYTEQVTPPLEPARLVDQVLAGLGVSPGVYEGTARIIRDEDDFERIEHGDVIVCPMTSPVWWMVFTSIGALVCDGGGSMSHPAIMARELGVPAVVGTGGATTTIPDGTMVRVDGGVGRVTLLG